MTNPMIDIHSHILPGLDDGAPDWEHAIAMARAAAADGITTIVATPHHANGVYLNPARQVEEAVRQYNERMKAEGIPLIAEPGQEIRVHDDLLRAWDRGELLTLGSSRYILLEMPTMSIPSSMGELLHELRVIGLTPIIAHPERNAEVIRRPERLAELIEAGAISQLTSHSLLGGFGNRIEQAAWMLISRGLAHVIASDVHHPELRGFRLREAYGAIANRFGDRFEEIFRLNAIAIHQNSTHNGTEELVENRVKDTGRGWKMLKFLRRR